jgi:nucleoside-diphosphate-sugar epimerase
VPLVEQPGGPIDPTPQIIKALQDRVERMVYFSTTGVYGNTWRVNEHTPTNPQTLRQQLRLAAEQAVLVGIKSPLVLRPAAIYGPGRNMYESIRQGRYRLVGDDSNFTSYIHVADLAAHAEAAFGATLTGAYPVADDYPCPAREIASYCAELLQMPLPPFVPLEQAHETLRFSRAVDGHAIRRALGISLQYSSYKVGLPASLAEVPTASAA